MTLKSVIAHIDAATPHHTGFRRPILPPMDALLDIDVTVDRSPASPMSETFVAIRATLGAGGWLTEGHPDREEALRHIVERNKRLIVYELYGDTLDRLRRIRFEWQRRFREPCEELTDLIADLEEALR